MAPVPFLIFQTNRTENGLICLNNNANCGFIEQLIKAIGKLAEFEDFMEEKGFESLEELKDSYETIKKSQASTHSALMTINEELVGTRQFIIKQTKENQALKSRWEKLKKFVNTPKEIQQWDERFEVAVDSIKSKMQELGEKWSTY